MDKKRIKSWQVLYYVSASGKIPVRDFLNLSKPTVKAKTFRIFQYLEEYGMQTVIPHIKKLRGTPLWEIRILGGDSTRILFITLVNKQILLLHAFYKKTQKTPLKEIQIAINRLKEHKK